MIFFKNYVNILDLSLAMNHNCASLIIILGVFPAQDVKGRDYTTAIFIIPFYYLL